MGQGVRRPGCDECHRGLFAKYLLGDEEGRGFYFDKGLLPEEATDADGAHGAL